MYGFEDSGLFTDVGARGKAKTAHQPGAQVRENVAEQVGGHHYIELMRVHDQLHAGVIHDHFLKFDLRILTGDFSGHVQKQAGAGLDDVGLVDSRHLFTPVLLGQLESVTHDALGALAGHLDHGKPGIAVVHHFLAIGEVGTFGIFPHGDHVDAIVA